MYLYLYSSKMVRSGDRWICSRYPARHSDTLLRKTKHKNTAFISRGEFFFGFVLLWCSAIIHHSGVVLCQPRGCLLLFSAVFGSQNVCYYQARTARMNQNVCAVAPWHHGRSVRVGKKGQCNCDVLCHYKGRALLRYMSYYEDKKHIRLLLWPQLHAGVFPLLKCLSLLSLCLSAKSFNSQLARGGLIQLTSVLLGAWWT